MQFIANDRGPQWVGATLVALCVAAGAVGPRAARADTEFQAWSGLFATVALPQAPDVVFWLDTHARKRDSSTLAIARVGAGYRFTPSVVAHVGYAWVPVFPEDGARTDEHRVWQQAVIGFKLGASSSFAVRPRLEQRFFDRGGDMGLRARLFLRGDHTLSADAPWIVAATNELFVNLNDVDAGPQGGFDQNRLFVGVGIRASDGTRAELGPMLTYSRVAGGDDLLLGILAINLFFSR